MVTGLPGIALGILTADCAPVLFADAEAGVIGAAHAGWKGALAGVLDNTVAAMERLGARPGRITAAIGPTISQANYEVGEDLRARFGADDARFFAASDRAGHFRFDLPGYVRQTAGAGRRRPWSMTWRFAPIRRPTVFSVSAAPPIWARPIMAGKYRR